MPLVVGRGDGVATDIYQKQTRPASRTHDEVRMRQFYLADLSFGNDDKLYATLTHHPEEQSFDNVITAYHDNDEAVVSETISVAILAEELVKNKNIEKIRRKPVSWTTNPARWGYNGTGVTSYTQQVIPSDSDYERVDSCSDLTFRRIGGKGAHKKVGKFLRGEQTPAVEHNLGDTGGKWKAAFGAFHTPTNSTTENLIAVLTIDNHQNRAYFEEHNSVLITRIACHPSSPKNCPTWMIARARNWAEEHGYDQIGSTAGVKFNRGMIYKAAGFELNTDLTGWQNGDGWTNRKGRSSVAGGNKWYKRKWEYSI